MQKFLSRTLNGLITVTAIILLMLHIFLLGDEDHRRFFDPKGVGCAVVFLKVRGFMEVVKDGLNGSWIREGGPLSLMEAQTGRNLPYLFS